MQDRKKNPSQDLSELKARLGLSKPQPNDVAASSSRPAATTAISANKSAQVRVTPLAPQPDARRDPFSSRIPPGQVATFSNAGPEIDIPQAKKNLRPVITAAVAIAAVALIFGIAFGKIWQANALYNKTIDDAGEIKKSVEEIAKTNLSVIYAVNESRQRTGDRADFDNKLFEALSMIVQTSPQYTPENAKMLEQRIFHTNYAFMADITIDRLFNFYNNSLRLIYAIKRFTDFAEANKSQLVEYMKSGTIAEQRKYGVVLAEDKGTFFIGALVEVGRPLCSDEKATREGTCRTPDITGFDIRTSTSAESWQPRSGKPKRKGILSDIVIPLVPDAFWQSVASAKPGFMTFEQYRAYYQELSAIAAKLHQDQDPLVKELSIQAKRSKRWSF